MQALHMHVVSAEGIRLGAKSNGIISEQSCYDDRIAGPSRVATTSRRSMEKRREVKRRYYAVQVNASWSSQLPTSPLFGATILSWAFKNSKAGRSWIRSVSSPPLENQQTANPDSSDENQQQQAELPVDAEAAPFEWKSNWYPVFPVIDADKSIPHAFQDAAAAKCTKNCHLKRTVCLHFRCRFWILGRKVVVWYDQGVEQWRTFLDMCPHRLAPLSEGRIDEHGCLQCCYHGWSFTGDGACARIPQALGDGPEAKAARNDMARCVSFPTVVKQGMLFIWPDESAHEVAAKTSPPITPGIDEPGWYFTCTFRDLAYGYGTGMENLVDPSHIPVAHHNVNGGVMGKREMAAPIQLQVTKQYPRGFEGQWNKPHGGAPSRHVFEAPTRFSYRFFLKQPGASGCTTTYCTPMGPGKSRILVINARNFMTQLSSGPEWWQLFPRWADHQMMLNLFDGDLALLHEQERNLRDVTNGHMEKWSKAFFMPTKADRYVGAFRQWLSRHGGNGVGYVNGVSDTQLPPLITKREDLLDRYHSHTEQCLCCSGALEGFKKAQTALCVLAILATGAGAALSATPQRYVAVAIGVLAALVAWYLNGWIRSFHYKGWDHSRLA